MSKDLQQQVAEWREKQPDLIDCQCLGNGQKIKKAICEKRQRQNRHFINSDFNHHQDMKSQFFYSCESCPYFTARKVKREAFKFGRVRRGRMPYDYKEDTYAVTEGK